VHSYLLSSGNFCKKFSWNGNIFFIKNLKNFTAQPRATKEPPGSLAKNKSQELATLAQTHTYTRRFALKRFAEGAACAASDKRARARTATRGASRLITPDAWKDFPLKKGAIITFIRLIIGPTAIADRALIVHDQNVGSVAIGH
jgi:hypothetical protein